MILPLPSTTSGNEHLPRQRHKDVWTLFRLNPFTSRKECAEVGVVSSLQNPESLCLDSLSLVVINFIIWSLADLETYPSPICCHTMEEQISGMRDHLWGRQSVSSVSVSGVF